jgi:hypothetical protein
MREHCHSCRRSGGLRSSARRRLLQRSHAAREFDVDVIVIAAEGGTVWHLTDLLGRSMGNIKENDSHQFTIYPEGHAFETMADMQRGPYASLDAALAEIERHTGGVCRRSTSEDQP